MNGWTAQECAEAWGVKVGTWLGYVSRGRAPAPLPEPGPDGRRRWDPGAVRGFARPGPGRSRASATPAATELLAAMSASAEDLDTLRARQRELAREGRARGVEVRAMARALRVSPQTVYGWLDEPGGAATPVPD